MVYNVLYSDVFFFVLVLLDSINKLGSWNVYIVTHMTIARQRLGKYIPEVNSQQKDIHC
jgi:hypothetical protein